MSQPENGLNKNIISNYDNFWLSDECILEIISNLNNIPLLYSSREEKKFRIFKSVEGLIDTISFEIYNKFENEQLNVADSINNIKFIENEIIIPLTDQNTIKIKSLNSFVTYDIYKNIKTVLQNKVEKPLETETYVKVN